jgi:hypothetical protein
MILQQNHEALTKKKKTYTNQSEVYAHMIVFFFNGDV